MMLPFRRRPTPQKPSSKDAVVNAPDLPSEPTVVTLHHLDYDLQPLNVENLSHYIAPVVDDERFRVH